MKRLHLLLPLLLLTVLFGSGFSGRPEPTELERFQKLRPKTVQNNIEAAYIAARYIKNPRDRQKALVNVAQAYSDLGQHDVALAVATKLKGQNAAIGRIRIYGLVGLAMAQNGLLEEATSMVKNIKKGQVRDHAIENLAIYLIDNNHIQLAEDIIPHIESPLIHSRLEGKLVDFYIRESKHETAFGIALRIQNKIEQERAFMALLIGYANILKIDRAQDTLNLIQSEEVRQEAYQKLAVALTKKLKLAMASEVANAISNDSHFYATLVQMSYALTDIKKFETTFEVIKQIQNDTYKNDALSYLAVSLAEDRQGENSLAIIDMITSQPVQMKTLGKLAPILAKGGLYDSAIETAKRIEPKSSSDLVLVEVAKNFGAQNDYFYPSLIINQIEDNTLRSRAAAAFAGQFAAHGQLNRIDQMLEDIRDSEILDQSYFDMAPLFATRDLKEEALAVTKRIEDYTLMCQAYLSLANIYADKSDTSHSVKMLQRMNRFVHLIRSLDTQVELYTGMAKVYTKLGGKKTPLRFTKEAFKVLDLIEPSKTTQRLTRTLITYLFDNGYYKEGYAAIGTLYDLPFQVELLENAPIPEDHKTRKKVKEYSRTTLKKILKRL